MKIKEISERLLNTTNIGNVEFKADLLKDDESGETALSVKIDGKEEFPILVVDFEETIICSAILFPIEDVEDEMLEEFMEELLGLNVVIPQCAFALQDDMVSIVRNMPITATAEDVIDAVSVLTSVAEDVIQDLLDYVVDEEETEDEDEIEKA